MNNYIYYNANQGVEEGILNRQFANSYEEAVKLFAWKEGVAEEEIVNDYEEHYYIFPVDEVAFSEEEIELIEELGIEI